MNRRFTSWIGRLALVLAISLVMIAPALAVQSDSGPPSNAAAHIQKSAAVPMLGAADVAAMEQMSSSTKVYIARTGKKYHKTNCRYVKQSKIKKTLKWVKAHGYGACKVCKPAKK